MNKEFLKIEKKIHSILTAAKVVDISDLVERVQDDLVFEVLAFLFLRDTISEFGGKIFYTDTDGLTPPEKIEYFQEMEKKYCTKENIKNLANKFRMIVEGGERCEV